MNLLDELKAYESDGWLISARHPTLPLSIWNYSVKTTYEKYWNSLTLRCRGLVVDDSGNVVAESFGKFFNEFEAMHLPTDDFDIFHKLDGQFIQLFDYDGNVIVTSRGSFTSKYAIEAERILNEKYPEFLQRINYKTTYCFELIGFERIVVSYSNVDLVLTGMFIGGVEQAYTFKFLKYEHFGIPIVQQFKGLDWQQIKQLNWQNSEGFVVRFSNGSRCKIKFEDYINLHGKMTNLSTTGIWEALNDGNPVSSILGDVPDEFYDKVREYENQLVLQYKELRNFYKAKYRSIYYKLIWPKIVINFERKITRKDFALLTLQTKCDVGIIFAQLDKKKIHKSIWKLIKPQYERI